MQGRVGCMLCQSGKVACQTELATQASNCVNSQGAPASSHADLFCALCCSEKASSSPAPQHQAAGTRCEGLPQAASIPAQSCSCMRAITARAFTPKPPWSSRPPFT